ncbi:piggyBac transposable element-derived protein 4 [Trichonephila clavipes]|uniref:PiggyBac transposable element-derived protein 4 n=1 Tax=Trichonephila clavipes TaxID=2585209 RepID=A0A8X6WC98_TRICX|nr:piggyBac transposable element-derived protein 4 [Trichonephila clavipes]
MGLVDKDNIKEYRSTDPMLETPFFKKIMPRDRFLNLLRYLHFENNDHAPDAWKLRNVFNSLNNSFQEICDPTEELAIDEVIVAFKGRIIFKQYIPKKRKRFGIKVYKIVDKKGYTFNRKVYLGADRERLKSGIKVKPTHATILELAESIKNKGHKLFMDNFFSSPELFQQLHKEYKMNSCGTMRSNRKHLSKRISFSNNEKSDEAHFWLNGYVNKQNCRIWSEANPQVYVETPLHPEKLTVWCALWAGGILLQNDEGHNVTVNGDRYRAMITNFFIPELNNHDVQELWFQQDGTTCHTARATIDLLKDTFGDRLISRFGPVNWPPRSCDLTPLDYFLWGYVKSLIYADKPQTLDHLEENIRRVIADIRPQMLEKVIENWTSRLDYTWASRGSPMPEIIFKM